VRDVIEGFGAVLIGGGCVGVVTLAAAAPFPGAGRAVAMAAAVVGIGWVLVCIGRAAGARRW
jgi:hypothetical protein